MRRASRRPCQRHADRRNRRGTGRGNRSHPLSGKQIFAVRLKNKTRLKIDAAKYADDVSLKAEFVRKACKAGLDDDALRDVLTYGFNALTNEEIDLL